MLRRATRGAFLSARQLRRAAAKKSTRGATAPGGPRAAASGRRELGTELLTADGCQWRAFGTACARVVPKALAVGALDLLDAGGAIGPRIPLLDALLEDDDDGR